MSEFKNVPDHVFTMRCFIAAHISDKVKREIAEFSKRLDKEKFKVVDEKNLHITIKFLGDVDKDEIELCRCALDDCVRLPVNVRFDGGGAFPNHERARVIFVNVISGELDRIANCIHNKTKGIGDEKPYIGHLTIARLRDGRYINAQKIIEEMKRINISGEIQTISLMKSTLTPSGPVYEEVYTKTV